jgi:tripartite-type tricarboxylate transporter receptor subunit TctC
LLLILALACGPALGQPAYPSKSLQFVVPYPPGGSNDIFGRALAKRLADAFGQPVVIDNKPGAGGSVGAGFVAKAAPDGYTIAIVSSSFTTNAAVQANAPFDPVNGFTPVAMLGKGPLILAVSQQVPAKTPQEFFALAKARGGKLNYASSGPGSINQFATELLKSAAGIDMTHVPYKGMGPATNDLIGGHVDVLVASVTSLIQHVHSGKVKGIGVTSLKTSALVPGLPALAESGAPGYEAELWWGILAPRGLPAAMLDKLNGEINKAVSSADMKEFLLREGAEPAPMAPAAFAAVVRKDIERWKKVAKEAGIHAE